MNRDIDISVPLQIPAEVLDAMVEHCRREAPLECCGLLGGKGSVVDKIYPLRNELASESRYRADSSEVAEAERDLRGRAAAILAIYHSHPKWAAIPSKSDLRENYYGDVPRIIVSLLGDAPDVRVWRLGPDSYEPLPWIVVPASPPVVP